MGENAASTLLIYDATEIEIDAETTDTSATMTLYFNIDVPESAHLNLTIDDTTTNDSMWRCVDLAYHKSFTNPVNLDTIKLTPSLSDMVLVKNSRLSVQPVTEREWNIICDMGQPQ